MKETFKSGSNPLKQSFQGQISYQSYLKIFDVNMNHILSYESDLWRLQQFDVIEKIIYVPVK